MRNISNGVHPGLEFRSLSSERQFVFDWLDIKLYEHDHYFKTVPWKIQNFQFFSIFLLSFLLSPKKTKKPFLDLCCLTYMGCQIGSLWVGGKLQLLKLFLKISFSGSLLFDSLLTIFCLS